MKNLRQLFRFRYIRAVLATLNREAAMDSVRHILMVFGAASVLGMLAVVRWFFILPALAFLILVWYVDYLRHDFHPAQTALEQASQCHKELCNLCGYPLPHIDCAPYQFRKEFHI